MRMEYIAVREAALNWGISVNKARAMCGAGLIPNVGRLGSMWLIPRGAPLPQDCGAKIEKPPEKPQDAPDGWKREPYARTNVSVDAEVQEESGDFSLFFEIIRRLPLVLHIFRPDGSFFYGNDAYFRLLGVTNPQKFNKEQNVLKDPHLKKWGLTDMIARTLRGEEVHMYDVKVPLQELYDAYGDGKQITTEILYQNFHSFPIHNAHGNPQFIATIFETSREYKGKEEIIRGQEYIENHWRDKFSLEEAAGACSLSRSHFSKLFKQHTGLTPHQYHRNLKIKHLQKYLLDTNLSVSRAFSECGMEYNSHYLDIFQEHTGMTPGEYRKEAQRPFQLD